MSSLGRELGPRFEQAAGLASASVEAAAGLGQGIESALLGRFRGSRAAAAPAAVSEPGAGPRRIVFSRRWVEPRAAFRRAAEAASARVDAPYFASASVDLEAGADGLSASAVRYGMYSPRDESWLEVTVAAEDSEARRLAVTVPDPVRRDSPRSGGMLLAEPGGALTLAAAVARAAAAMPGFVPARAVFFQPAGPADVGKGLLYRLTDAGGIAVDVDARTGAMDWSPAARAGAPSAAAPAPSAGRAAAAPGKAEGRAAPAASPVRYAAWTAAVVVVAAVLIAAAAFAAAGAFALPVLGVAGMLLVPERLPNPAQAYATAHKAALERLGALGVPSERLHFGEATAILPARGGVEWKFTFYLVDGPKGRQADALYVDVSRDMLTVSGQWEVREHLFRNVAVPEGGLPYRLEPYYFGAGAQLTPDTALDIARVKSVGLGTRVSVSLRMEEEPESGDKDLWYRFYDEYGGVVAVNARTGEAREVRSSKPPVSGGLLAGLRRLLGGGRAASDAEPSPGRRSGVTDDDVLAAARAVASYKGMPWSQTEYNSVLYPTLDDLRSRGASAAQVELFLRACAEAPLRGGSFNPWSGD